MSATPAWEQSKENTAPLERGRNVVDLGQRPTRLSQRELNGKIEEYEKLVCPSEDSHVTEMDGDPLIHWLAYIKFYQARFPADTRDNFLLMERCVRALVKMKQYANDDRFLGVCAKYADKTKDPGQIFKYLHQQKVGTLSALFWIAWAFVAEKDNNFAFAEQVFRKGISKNAQPLQALTIRHKQFQRRMSRQWLDSSVTNNVSQNDEYEDDDASQNRSRSTLGGLTRYRLQNNNRGRNSSQRDSQLGGMASGLFDNTNHQRQRQGNAVGSFSIFVEENQGNGYSLDQSYSENDQRVIDREAERKKENDQEAEQWNQRGGLHSNVRKIRQPIAGASAPFSVFVDEECYAQSKRQEDEKRKNLVRQQQVRDERTFRDRGSEGMAEALVRDPLRYVRDPSQIQSDVKSPHPKPASDSTVVSRLDNTKTQRTSRIGFNKRLLKSENGEEQCFEEARAGFGSFTVTIGCRSNFNVLHKATPADSSSTMDIEEVETSSISILMVEATSNSTSNSLSSKHPQKLQRIGSKVDARALFQPDTSFEAGLNQTAISNASSTINEIDAVGVSTRKDEATINTKVAMKELSMMFSSPAFGVDGRHKHLDYSATSQVCETTEEGRADQLIGIIGDSSMLDNSICNTGFNECNGNGTAKMTHTKDKENQIIKAKNPNDHGVGFQIFQDFEEDNDDGENRDAGDKQASENPSCEDSDGANKTCYWNGDTICVADAKIFMSDAGAQSSSDQIQEDDAATFSGFNEVFEEVCDGSSLKSRHDPSVGAFEVYIDSKENFNEDGTNNSTAFAQRLDVVRSSEQRLSHISQNGVTEYHRTHDHDVQMSLRRIQTTSALVDASRAPLSILLLATGQSFHLPTIQLPYQLRRRSQVFDTQVHVGKHEGIVRKELGRGAYGIVFLMKVADKSQDHNLAIKVQAPTDSLAWEFEVLQRLETRCSLKAGLPCSFPRPFSLVALADGGILGMSAASTSGLNLVDLSNFYKLSLGETVPEVIALHYTSTALRIIEDLHWHGMILHCDVKPDNFVLSSSQTSQFTYDDLTLVDFGRAIDLKQVESDDTEIRNRLFTGEALPKEMQCVAMRTQRAWSYDVDTYGILCSAHILLYGSHLEIRKGKGNRWHSKAALKRYWQRELWTEVYNTLLNLDELGTATGSRPSSLRLLRRKIDAYLSTERAQDKLKMMLSKQSKMLPESREKFGA